MSTNFYLVPTDTTDTDDKRALHVLKRSAGYTIAGHRETPFGSIESWAQWRDLLTALPDGWRLMSEYAVTIDPAELIAEVEAFDRPGRAAHVREHERALRGHRMPSVIPGPWGAWRSATDDYAGNRWRDAEGFLILGVEFY